MPSPLPGMDPFLESPDRFPTFHNVFLVYLHEQLQGRLPTDYSVSLEERTYIEAADDPPSRRVAIPDLSVKSSEGIATGTALATLDVAEEPLWLAFDEEETTENYLNIYHGRQPNERLVTTIELLSPANKAEGSRGRDLYMHKQQDLVAAGVHLVEIDLLRVGRHATAIPESYVRNLAGNPTYHISIREFHRPDRIGIYPIPLRNPLPAIRIPLLPGDGTVQADLQPLMNRAWDAGPFRKRVRYAVEDCPPPLADDERTWIGECLSRWQSQPSPSPEAR